jgi:hypothetical protein
VQVDCLAASGKQMKEIQKRLVHTTSKTSEIYIKEAIPELPTVNMHLPWEPI